MPPTRHGAALVRTEIGRKQNKSRMKGRKQRKKLIKGKVTLLKGRKMLIQKC